MAACAAAACAAAACAAAAAASTAASVPGSDAALDASVAFGVRVVEQVALAHEWDVNRADWEQLLRGRVDPNAPPHTRAVAAAYISAVNAHERAGAKVVAVGGGVPELVVQAASSLMKMQALEAVRPPETAPEVPSCEEMPAEFAGRVAAEVAIFLTRARLPAGATTGESAMRWASADGIPILRAAGLVVHTAPASSAAVERAFSRVTHQGTGLHSSAKQGLLTARLLAEALKCELEALWTLHRSGAPMGVRQQLLEALERAFSAARERKAARRHTRGSALARAAGWAAGGGGG